MLKRIVWMTWKDARHPLAGGAERVNEEIARQMVMNGYEVIFLVSGYLNAPPTYSHPDGFLIVRCGGRFSVYWAAYKYYKRFLRNWSDLVIDEMNTIPFFAKFYTDSKCIVLAYQLCRQIWFYQMKFPGNLIGYFLESLYLRLINKMKVLTESQSAKDDLIKFGFKNSNIKIFRVPLDIEPIKNIDFNDKFEYPTLLSLGSIMPMKRTLDQVKAFEIVKKDLPNCKMIIVGKSDSDYGSRVLNYINKSKFNDDINYLGHITDDDKMDLLRRSHLIMVTSVKEGWGLIVTEANSQGTPAVVYNVDGLRDSVKDGITGIICSKNTPEYLARGVVKCLNPVGYSSLRKSGWDFSKEFTPENSYKDFMMGIQELCK